MAVDFHRHCQKTVLSASGTTKGSGKTWSTISDLSSSLTHLPDGWVNTYFYNNTQNITQDFASVLKLLDNTTGELKSSIGNINTEITNIKGDLTNVKGQIGLIDEAVVCYIAPDQSYFDANSGSNKLFTKHTDDGVYYTLNTYDASAPNCAYSLGTDHRIYPGNDSNLELQYAATNDGEKRKYPLFTLNQALKYLRRFRANGAIQYRIRTQYGTYDFGIEPQDIRLLDAVGGSNLYIGPKQSDKQLQALPCMRMGYTGFTEPDYTATGADNPNKFKDSDVVNVNFVWHDNGDSTLHGQGLYYMYFFHSNTYVDGIGFYLKRDRTPAQYQNSGATVLYICVQSGYVRFTQCVFRNAFIGPSGSQSPAPNIVMYYKFARTPTYRTDQPSEETTYYNLDNLNYFQLPNVFVDDPPISGVDKNKSVIAPPYMIAGASDNTVISNQQSFVIIRMRRQNYPLSIGPSNALRWYISWNPIGKWIIYHEVEKADMADPNNPWYMNKYRSYQIINNQIMTTVRMSQPVIPSTAVNKTMASQTRIEIVSKDITGNNLVRPTWLTSSAKIFVNSSSGYDQTKGTYSNFIEHLGNNLVKYNGEYVS